jgi:threonine/homoserine/homoserine lactone efflux protein
MPSFDILLTFFVTTALFAFIPGPAMLYAAAQTLSGGRRAGLMASLGIHLGCYVHVISAAAGLSILFQAVPMLYAAVKLTGAGYLIWLGISMFRSHDTDAATDAVASEKRPGRAFLHSIGVEVLNPKTAIFFMAFLPQFIDASAALPVWAQLLILGTMVNLTFSAADLICVALAGSIMTRVRRSGGAQRLMRRAGGSILVGLGAHLALQRT